MIRFEHLQELGATLAVVSERADGDCRLPHAKTPSTGRARLAEPCGFALEKLVCGQQTHGVNIARITEAEAGRGGLDKATALPNTDALITDVPGLPLGVTVADCVPVFMLDPRRKAIALVHAGREGTRQAIARLAIERMAHEYGSDPADIHALIGPSAGPCCYEVDSAMADQWRALGFIAHERMLDLWRTNALQLRQAGLPPAQIHLAELCTVCDGRFFSHRVESRQPPPARCRNLAVFML